METGSIYNEDCRATMERMAAEGLRADIVLTSPPYNMTSRKGGYADTGRYDVYEDWKGEEEYVSGTVDRFRQFDGAVAENGVVLYNFSYSVENPSLPYKLVAAVEAGTPWTLVDTVIWKKACGLPFPANERRLSRIWEFVWVFARKAEVSTFRCNKGVKSVSEKTGQRYYNVFYNFVEARNNDAKTPTLNQATYSSDLCEKMLSVYAAEGYLVYDPYMGTGTTAVAAARKAWREWKNGSMRKVSAKTTKKDVPYNEEDEA